VKNVIKRAESYALEICDKLFVCQLSKTHYSSLGKEKNAAIKNTCTKIQMKESSTYCLKGQLVRFSELFPKTVGGVRECNIHFKKNARENDRFLKKMQVCSVPLQ
jgi:hypothetical protein